MKKSSIYLSIIFLGLVAVLTGCTGKKEKVTEIPVTTQSREALNFVRQGLAASDLGDNQKARKLFIKAVEQDPKLAIAYLLKVTTDITSKEVAEDMEKAKANLDGVSDWEKLYFEYTATFMNSDWNKRLAITQKIAAAYPNAARPQVDLGYTYRSNIDVSNERACFTKAVELDPKWAGGYSALVSSFLFSDPKDFKKAEENALKVVELAPSSPGAEISLGDCYRAQNILEKARDAYSKAVDLDPNSSEAYYKKGHANTFLGNFDEARQNYTDGGKYDESAVTSVQFIAYTYLYSGDAKAAWNFLNEQAAKTEGSGNNDPRMVFARTMFLQDCASIALFNQDVPRLKALIPMLEPLFLKMGDDLGTQEAKLGQKAYVLQWQSLLAASEGNFDVARAKAEEIKTTLEPVKDPNKLDSYEFTLGYICMKQKKFKDAVSHFEKTQQTSISNKYWLAVALEAAGNKEKAKTLYIEIAGYNFNGIDFALIRNEVKKKVASL